MFYELVNTCFLLNYIPVNEISTLKLISTYRFNMLKNGYSLPEKQNTLKHVAIL